MPFQRGLTRLALAPRAAAPIMHLEVNRADLRRAWESSQRSTKDDWAEWMRHFAVELLRESPSPALRATSPLALVRNWIPCVAVMLEDWLGLLPARHGCIGHHAIPWIRNRSTHWGLQNNWGASLFAVCF